MKTYQPTYLQTKSKLFNWSFSLFLFFMYSTIGILIYAMILASNHDTNSANHILNEFCFPTLGISFFFLMVSVSNIGYNELSLDSYKNLWQELLFKNDQELTDQVRKVFKEQNNRLVLHNKYELDAKLKKMDGLILKSQKDALAKMKEYFA